MLEIIDLCHGFADKQLYKNVNLRINKGDKIGLVGENGSGKSTLVNILTNKIICDKGQVKTPKNLKIGYLDQYAIINEELTIYEYLSSAFSYLLEKEKLYDRLNEKATDNSPESQKLLIKAYSILEELLAQDFFSLENTIKKFASGLGITLSLLDTKIKNISGGQRAKIILCKLLLEKPDLLILDEPTNHLDSNHIEWLSKFLIEYENAFLVVSHNTDFLNKICNIIWSVEFNEIYKYSGNYKQFLRQHEERVERQTKVREAQEKQAEVLSDFIARKSAKTCTARMAQSKKKQLEKIEFVEKLEELPMPTYNFKFKPIKATDAIIAKDLTIGYTHPLISGINLNIKIGQKLAITGFNGLGKSTLLKTLLGEIPALSGSVEVEPKLTIGYFEQNLNWHNSEDTALSEIRYDFKNLTEKEARGFLARAGLLGRHLKLPIKRLSGGEQAKIKLCKFMINSYNVLFFDEPTNHLDVKAKTALVKAINEFEGTVIFVSHEQEFAKLINCEILNLEKLKTKKD